VTTVNRFRDPAALRIAYVFPGFCADESDWCIPVFANLIREMVRHGEITVYPLHYPFRPISYDVFGATVHGLSRRKRRGIGRLRLWRDFWQRVSHDHRQAPFDLIHGFWATETGFLAAHAARRLGIPSVVSIAGGEFARLEGIDYGAARSPIHRRIVHNCLQTATAVTAGSEWLARLAPDSIRSKLTTLPFGVDPAMFASAPTRRSGRRLLAASSLSELKDYPTLLQGIALARRTVPDLCLEIAGAGVEMEHLRMITHELGLEEAVRFNGFVSYEDMPTAYRSADVLLHSSLYEAQGMVILEALATGLPVVASNVGIAADLPEDLVYRFTPGDPRSLAGALLRSIATTEHAERVAATGPGLIHSAYSVHAATATLLELYRKILPVP